jgi:thiol:disulfide interchange protein DsbD
LLGLWFTSTISAKESSNKELEKLLFLENKILPADQVFKLKVDLRGGKIFFRWDIEKKCYLYLDKFSFEVNNSNDYLYPPFPRGKLIEDEYFGKVEVFFDKVETFFRIDTLSSKEIIITYQGCNQEGYCYTPIKKYILVNDDQTILIN